MSKYELTDQQAENLKALLMDSNIKGSAAATIVELIDVLNHPVDEVKDRDLHSEHNDGKRHSEVKP